MAWWDGRALFVVVGGRPSKTGCDYTSERACMHAYALHVYTTTGETNIRNRKQELQPDTQPSFKVAASSCHIRDASREFSLSIGPQLNERPARRGRRSVCKHSWWALTAVGFLIHPARSATASDRPWRHTARKALMNARPYVYISPSTAHRTHGAVGRRKSSVRARVRACVPERSKNMHRLTPLRVCLIRCPESNPGTRRSTMHGAVNKRLPSVLNKQKHS